MPGNPFSRPCPPELEDEAFLIENAGEMPEVALAESRLVTGPLFPPEEQALAAACARGYYNIIRRDLTYRNLGHYSFRGLERAQVNLARLTGFLKRLNWGMPREAVLILARDLENYLTAEQKALEAGRSYASATPEQVKGLCAFLGLELGPWQGLLQRMAELPAPDFLGLKALARLAVPGAAFKRLTPADGLIALELMGEDGSVLKAALLPLQGPGEGRDPEAEKRLQKVWAALDYPEAEPNQRV